VLPSVQKYYIVPLSQLNLQYFAVFFLGDGWTLGMSPSVLVDWKATSDNKLTFPIGLSVGRAVKFSVEDQDMPVHPDGFGQNGNVQFMINPVTPRLIKGRNYYSRFLVQQVSQAHVEG
jgi:hypothetical protein